MRPSDSVLQFRQEVAKIFRVPYDSFLISKVQDGKVLQFFNQNGKVSDLIEGSGKAVVFEIPTDWIGQ